MIDLFRETLRAQGDPRIFDVAARHDVPPEVADHLGLAPVMCGPDIYEPHPDGEIKMLVPVMDDGEIIDILAMNPNKPDRWFLRLGVAVMLGSDALCEQVLGAPLRVHRTPLSWLRAGCDGVVPLDLDAALPDLLCAPHGIAVEDMAHGRDLDRRLRTMALANLPRIRVPTERRAAA